MPSTMLIIVFIVAIPLLIWSLTHDPIMAIAKRNKLIGPWLNERLIRCSVVTLTDVLKSHNLDKTTLDGFNRAQAIMLSDIQVHKAEFNTARELEIDQTLESGLLGFLDLIVVYTYVLTQHDVVGTLTEYRQKYTLVAEKCLINKGIPVTWADFVVDRK